MRSPSKRGDLEAKYDVVLDCECALLLFHPNVSVATRAACAAIGGV